jgi:hypothetical protein
LKEVAEPERKKVAKAKSKAIVEPEPKEVAKAKSKMVAEHKPEETKASKEAVAKKPATPEPSGALTKKGPARGKKADVEEKPAVKKDVEPQPEEVPQVFLKIVL